LIAANVLPQRGAGKETVVLRTLVRTHPLVAVGLAPLVALALLGSAAQPTTALALPRFNVLIPNPGYPCGPVSTLPECRPPSPKPAGGCAVQDAAMRPAARCLTTPLRHALLLFAT
jgi:hypothetical protein